MNNVLKCKKDDVALQNRIYENIPEKHLIYFDSLITLFIVLENKKF